jgi:methyl-accepting chemotaxis protein
MISSQTSTLVIDSFRTLSPNREALVESFYERLFRQHPEVKPMFAKADKTALRRKLLLALITIVDSLEDNEQLRVSLHGISETHTRHHVKAEHYQIFSKILLATLADFLPDTWNQTMALAWRDALDHITEIIISFGEQSNE